MTDKTLSLGSRRVVGGNYFGFMYLKPGKKTLQHYLTLFNIDDYNIYKASNRFKKVSKEEFMEFKYAIYLLIKKDYKHCTDEFIEYYNKLNIDLVFKYLIKPIEFNIKELNIKIIDSL